jgi:serine/threonine protein kinase
MPALSSRIQPFPCHIEAILGMNPAEQSRLQTTGAHGKAEAEHGSVGGGLSVAETGAPPVPDYELLRRVGGGAYGEVWLARSKATGAMRAAKIVWRRSFQDERPFQREFEGIQRFERVSREHPSQLALFHIGRNEAEGYFYYVMELADDASAECGVRSAESRAPHSALRTPQAYVAHTLRADLAKGRLPASRVLEIGLALAEALGHLHHNGLVHRDVKPSNVIFVNGRPKLADIGLVTDLSDQCSIVGTEGYLPPEGPGTPQADIFALGKVLYEAATGLDRQRFPQLPPDVHTWADTTQVFELNEIMLRACAKNPASRYSNCQEMHDELARVQAGQSIIRHRLLRRRLRRLSQAAAAAAAIVLATAGGIFLWRLATGYNAPIIVVGDGEALSSPNAKAVEAYQLGLQGLRSETPDDARKAQANFNQAIKRDPRFVSAYARLFEAHLISGGGAGPSVEGKAEKLNELAATLRKIAPTNAETHAATAVVRFLNEWRWDEAEKEFKEARRINPDCHLALTYYGYFLTRLCRSKEAREVLERAQKRDQRSGIIATFLGHCDYAQRDFNAALEGYQDAFNNRNQLYPGAHYWAGRACMAMTNYFEGLRQLEKNEEMQGLGSRGWYETVQKVVEQNPKDPARAFYGALIEVSKPDEPNTDTPYRFATRYARVGDWEHALKLLEAALAKHDSGMGNLLFDDTWDPYRREPWFREIVKKVGLARWQ